ncbi:MAG: 23S rRNA (guanosine(2251)-2'-O)-methyltransferase RlmB [Candidatus Dormibacteraceae bacterium]
MRKPALGPDRRDRAAADGRPRRPAPGGRPFGLRENSSARSPQGPPKEIIHGRNPVLEAARAGHLRRVMLAVNLDPDPRLEEIRRLAPVVTSVGQDDLDLIAPGVHQGVAAELEPRRFFDLSQVLKLDLTLLVALDGIQDPQNLGAVLRSAEAAGAGAVILPERRSAPIGAAAVKASAGASEHLRICKVAGLPSALSTLKRAGYWCLALDPQGETWPWEFDLTQKICVVVGGEGQGVHRLVRERCEVRLRLPMAGQVASLNASAAAAALFYEVGRQRWVKAGQPEP